MRFSALGDVILTSPAIEALHAAWPHTRIVFAIKERLAPLVAHNPNVAEVISLRAGEGPLHFAKRLRVLGPRTAVLDLHGKVRSQLLRALLPVGWRRVVWEKRSLHQTLTAKLGLGRPRATALFADRYHHAVERLVGKALPRGKLRAFVGPEDVAAAESLLQTHGVDLGRPLLGMSPGARWQTKRWPIERFAELAKTALLNGVQVVVQGSAEEKALGAAIVQHAPKAVDLCGQLDLGPLGGLIAKCSAFVSNDSGPMHLARGLGVPTLALFGSTDPAMFTWEGHAVLFAGLECSPCSLYGRAHCPKGHFRCMLDLGPDQAWRSLQGLLATGRQPLLSA